MHMPEVYVRWKVMEISKKLRSHLLAFRHRQYVQLTLVAAGLSVFVTN